MSLDQVVSSMEGPAAYAARVRPTDPARERRRKPRRATDCDQQSLAVLATWFIEREPMPTIILDRQLRVLLRNACAAHLLRKIASIDANTAAFKFSDKHHQRELLRVLNEEVERAELQVCVSGVPQDLQVTAIRAGHAGTLFVRVSASLPETSIIQRIKTQLKLTQAESEIALAISRGCSLAQIAKARSASINTVKTQVRYIYQKTAVCSQVGLTRLVARIV